MSYCGNLEKWYISRIRLESSHPQCPKDIQYLIILPLEDSSWSTPWKRDDPLKVRNQFPKWCFPRHVDLPTARCLFLQLGAVQRYYNLKSKQKAGRRTEKWSSTVHARSKIIFLDLAESNRRKQNSFDRRAIGGLLFHKIYKVYQDQEPEWPSCPQIRDEHVSQICHLFIGKSGNSFPTDSKPYNSLWESPFLHKTLFFLYLPALKGRWEWWSCLVWNIFSSIFEISPTCLHAE